MAKTVLFFLTVIALSFKAQDTIITKSNAKIVSLILLSGRDSVRYKKLSNISGPDLYLKTSEIKYLVYKNGTHENIDSLYPIAVKEMPRADVDPFENSDYLYSRGQQDARVFYNRSRGSIPIGIASLLVGPVSTPVVLVYMLTPVAEKRLNYPDKEIWKNYWYNEGYRTEAKRLKRNRAGAIHFICAASSMIVYGLIIGLR